MQEAMIRVFERLQDGRMEPVEDYDVPDFGGVLPQVGDFFVSPGVTQGLNRQDPANRTVSLVVARYIQPVVSMDGRAAVALVVESRPGALNEVNVL